MQMNHVGILELCCVGLSLFAISNIWFVVRVLRPIRRLSHQAVRLSAGHLDALNSDCGGIPEVRELHRAMSAMVGHVCRAQEQSRVYADQLADGQETERKHIAHELHDVTVQTMIAVTQHIDIARSWLQSNPSGALDILDTARQQAIDAVTTLRNLIGGLRPPALEELGLVAALEMQLGSIDHIDVQFLVSGGPRRLDEAYELTLFRATQEGLRNVERHSQATRATIELDYQPTLVSLRIVDNGCGFILPRHLGELAFDEHYGLLGIQERVVMQGGNFIARSQPGQGTELHILMPTAILQPSDQVRDPVCSTLISPNQAFGHTEVDEVTYYFCCPVCQGAFRRAPDLYLHPNVYLSEAASQPGVD